ncbi:MAG: alpha/beta hydrolase [bacterium]
MPKKLLITLAAGIGLVLLFPWINRLIERRLVYHPQPFPPNAGQLSHRLPVKEVWFESEDGTRLNGWFLKKPGAAGSLLWLHGNAGNLTDCLEALEGMRRALSLNILIFDYRGYGKSEGFPWEKALYQDSEAALALLKSLTPNQPVFLYAHSLGVAVGIELSLRHPFTGAIYESGFTSLYDMGKLTYPWLPIRLLAGKKFLSVAKVSRIFFPKLFIHGSADEVVPFRQGERLFAAAAEPKRFYRVPEGDHNNNHLIDRKNYYRIIRKFVSIGGKTVQ